MALHWSFSSAFLAENLQIPPANGIQARAAEKVYQKLLSNEMPGHIDKVKASHIIQRTWFRIYRKKYINRSIISEEHLQEFKSGNSSYSGLDLSIHVNKPYSSGVPVRLTESTK